MQTNICTLFTDPLKSINHLKKTFARKCLVNQFLVKENNQAPKNAFVIYFNLLKQSLLCIFSARIRD